MNRPLILPEPPRYENSPAFFVARETGTIALISNSYVNITYDKTYINDNGCLDVVSGVFTCPKAGRIFCRGAINVTNNSGSTLPVFLRLVCPGLGIFGESMGMDNSFTHAPGQSITYQGSAFLDVNSGSQLALQIGVFGGVANHVVNAGLFAEAVNTFSGFYLA